MKVTAIIALLAWSSAALASTENTKQACSDGVDNDGDGRVDCADQDCWDLVMCAKPDSPSTRGSGYTKVVAGAVLLPLGLILAAVSAGPWVLSHGSDGGSGGALIGAAVSMDVVGLAAIAAGTALLAMGVGTVASSRDRRVTLAPSVGARSASLSLFVTF